MRTNRFSTSLVALGAAVTLTACGANAGGGAEGGDEQGDQGEAPLGKVGVILPETASSARWEGFDKPLLEEALRAEGFDPDVQNAQGEVQKFTTLADGMIAQGVEVLVIASINSEVGSAVAAQANNAGIPTIDYDRLNLGGSSDYYVSFDNVRVGELQGEGIAEALEGQQGAEVIEIEGAPTDNNATLFHEGQRNILDPLYESGALKLVQSQPIDNWDNQRGGTTFEQILTANGGTVDGVVAANDGLAGAVITVLRKNGLNGAVPVTGQDATPDGLRRILRGDQYMTVFKPIKAEAEATAELAAALATGDTDAADALADDVTEDPRGGRDVKSVLLEPHLITKDNVKRVIDEGYVDAADVCTEDLADVCAELGIT
ncbi:sugar ABC transporter substrate-binding protein [Saccharomonospora saliphila]|uniref:sugar ABC transporter substrate-binding protein n=1 Tax=Saccharomonospora saliphila TaxID=369829 RepID=UPI00037A1F7E|nr:substrate-binding domain-containing protein [Saccharomonospora saliphila]